MHLSSQLLLRIMIGVYSRISQGTTGLYCPPCPGTAQLSRYIGNTYICTACSKQLRQFSASDDKHLRPPTLDDLKGWAAAMNTQGCMAKDVF